VIKETNVFSTKSILAAASLAVLSAAGLGSAAAAPWDHRTDRHDGYRHDRLRHEQFERRAFVDRVRLTRALRFHSYRMLGEPYFVHNRYVVRTHDRFGRIVFVQVDPYSGAFIRETRL
jgi:hypothetical protein